MKVILIGAGGRGTNYTDLMADDRFDVVAVAEPVKDRREYIKNKHNIPEELCFSDWKPLLEKEKFADAAVIATMDKDHFDPTMAAIEKGYHLLLEKPVSPSVDECVKIANYAKEKGAKIMVCHVLRFSPFFRCIKDSINDGKLGDVISIHHAENVGNVHQSHSFVRGNWGNSKKSSFMLLQKSCHDMDIIQWLMDSPCKSVQSFGSLTHFTAANAPQGSPDYCIEGCPHGDKCPYNAVKLYYDDKENLWFREAAAKKPKPSDEDILEVLKTTQYGKCVYKCDNDVVDHQVVNLEFENGAVASFNMCAFNQGNRCIRIMGTKGEIIGDMNKNSLEYYNFETKETTVINPSEKYLTNSIVDGHSGGDSGIVEIFYKYIEEGYYGDDVSEIGISVDNHIIAFAAEKSRLERRVVEMKDYRAEIGLK